MAISDGSRLRRTRISRKEAGAVFDRFLQRKIGFRALLRLGLVGLIVFVLFGAVVRVAAVGDDRYGLIGRIALHIASIPVNFRKGMSLVLHGEKEDLKTVENRFAGQTAFQFSYPPGSAEDAEYLLLSRYDGDRKRSVVELVDMNTQALLHRWAPDFAAINARSELVSNLVDLERDRTPSRVRVMHPLLLDDGDLVYQDMSPLVRVGPCGEIRWTIDRLFHHSNEFHSEGGFWLELFLEPQTISGVSKTFKEDAIVHVSPDGEILFEKSVPELLIENGLAHFVYGLDFYSDDPTHLNDVQQAIEDTRFWKKGDVFLSLRNVSAIVLYRPSENRVVRLKQGPWVNQHDVDILDDHRIAVFNNNRFNYNTASAVDGFNSVMIYDFSTDVVSSPYADGMKKHEVRTISEGRSEIYQDGQVFLEESNYGRAMRLDQTGEIVWQYVNRGSDGQLYRLNWSRVIPREIGDSVARKLAELRCPGIG